MIFHLPSSLIPLPPDRDLSQWHPYLHLLEMVLLHVEFTRVYAIVIEGEVLVS